MPNNKEMTLMIHAIQIGDTKTTAFTNEKIAEEQLEQRKSFLNDEFGQVSIEPLMLVLTEEDIKNIILENIDLAKTLLPEKEVK